MRAPYWLGVCVLFVWALRPLQAQTAPTASFLTALNVTYWTCNSMYCNSPGQVVTVAYPSYTYAGCSNLNEPRKSLGNPSSGQWGTYCGAVSISFDICYSTPVVPNAYQNYMWTQATVTANSWRNPIGITVSGSNSTSSSTSGYTSLGWGGNTITPSTPASTATNVLAQFYKWNTVAAYCWNHYFVTSASYYINQGNYQYLCPAGYYALNFTYCATCPAGTWNDDTSSAWCYTCQAGKYSAASQASSSNTCLPCAAGTYSAASGASSSNTCLQCAAGTYSPTTGLSVCTSCPSYGWSLAGATACYNNTYPIFAIVSASGKRM